MRNIWVRRDINSVELRGIYKVGVARWLKHGRFGTDLDW